MKYKIEVTRQYLKDLKLARKRNLDEAKLNEVIRLLSEGTVLPEKYRDHVLTGNYRNIRECHITPDWLRLYAKEATVRLLSLIRTGTHSDLF